MTSTEASNPAHQLAALIAHDRDEIMKRWLERVRADIARAPGVGLTQLRDGMPEYLEGLSALLGGPSPTVMDGARDLWATVAREHGVTRVRIGFDVGQLVHELIVLRHVIRGLGAENGMSMAGPEAVLADVLDAAIGLAVQAYVDAREHDRRRRQAEHVAFLTHELRNPLGTAMLTTSLLRRRVPQEAPALDKLDRSHRRLSEMIDGVLLTERLEAGTIQSHPSDVALGPIIDASVDAARASASHKGVTMRVSCDGALRACVDPVLTRSAIQNLVESAVYHADHGEVEIAVERTRDDVVIHVRDECPTISSEQMRTIFEPFERGETPQPGAGLGLVIARRAIEAQGGSMHAEHAGPTGCHFWLTLPRHVHNRGGT